MSRYDIALNKKKSIINKALKEIKKATKRPKKNSITDTSSPPNVSTSRNRALDVLRQVTPSGGPIPPESPLSVSRQVFTLPPIRYIPTDRGSTATQSLEPRFGEARETGLSINGDGNINGRGPTSRHLIIAGPDGFRIIISLRSLRYRVDNNRDGTSDFIVTLTNGIVQNLVSDIQGGMARQDSIGR